MCGPLLHTWSRIMRFPISTINTHSSSVCYSASVSVRHTLQPCCPIPLLSHCQVLQLSSSYKLAICLTFSWSVHPQVYSLNTILLTKKFRQGCWFPLSPSAEFYYKRNRAKHTEVFDCCRSGQCIIRRSYSSGPSPFYPLPLIMRVSLAFSIFLYPFMVSATLWNCVVHRTL